MHDAGEISQPRTSYKVLLSCASAVRLGLIRHGVSIIIHLSWCRMTFLGLICGLYTLSYVLWGFMYMRLSRRQKKLALRDQAKSMEMEANRLSPDARHTVSKGTTCEGNKQGVDGTESSTWTLGVWDQCSLPHPESPSFCPVFLTATVVIYPCYILTSNPEVWLAAFRFFTLFMFNLNSSGTVWKANNTHVCAATQIVFILSPCTLMSKIQNLFSSLTFKSDRSRQST